MQVNMAKRLTLRRSGSSWLGRRHFSAAAQAEAAAPHENEVAPPRMPLFHYTPPPYTGPSAADILAKRREFLSPSMPHLYKKPVSSLHPHSVSFFIVTRNHSTCSFLIGGPMPFKVHVVGVFCGY